jgi:hypothetical protein
MEKGKIKKLLKRFTAKTPAANKRRGRLMTVIGTAASALLLVGAITNPFGIAALTTIAALSGGTALYDGAQVESKKQEDEQESK